MTLKEVALEKKTGSGPLAFGCLAFRFLLSGWLSSLWGSSFFHPAHFISKCLLLVLHSTYTPFSHRGCCFPSLFRSTLSSSLILLLVLIVASSTYPIFFSPSLFSFPPTIQPLVEVFTDPLTHGPSVTKTGIVSKSRYRSRTTSTQSEV